MQQWCNSTLTGDLDEVPHVGGATISELKKDGVKSTWQLFGKFITHLNENVGLLTAASRFKDDLANAGSPVGHRDSVVSAVAERVYSGFKCPMEMDDDRRSSSRMTHAKMEKFLEKDLSGDLASDFDGIGSESAKKLRKAGVHTSWQLFGKALEFDGDADRFEDFLTNNGTASGYKATVTHQVAEKLAHGLHLPDISELRGQYMAAEPPSPVPFDRMSPKSAIPSDSGKARRSEVHKVASSGSSGAPMSVVVIAMLAILLYFVMG